MLQYDNSAFYFFALSTISFYLAPSWYAILTRVYRAFMVKDADIGAIYRTTAEKKKAEQIKKDSAASKSLQSTGFLINLGITLVLSLVFVWLLISVSTDGEVNSFDPFSILEIDSNSDTKVIKKAYRSLSLRYHPDKNPGDRAAAAKFMMVSKAYEALTDEQARKNWEMYGNPDGKQSLEVSIGLPDFLLEQKNRNLVLFGYLILMVGLVPYFVWKYYSYSSKYGEKDVMYDTYSWYHHALSEHTVVKNLPETMAGSAEFRKRNMPKTPEQKQAVAQLMAAVKSNMQKPKYNHPVCIKGNVLLHVHLLRKTALLAQYEQEREDLKYMLSMSTALIDAMISVCKHQDALQTAIHCIEFGQYVTQAMWVKDSELLQMPHFTAEEVKHCEKGKKKVASIAEYREQPDEDKKGMADFTETQKQDVLNFLRIFPNISVEAKVYVDDDEDNKVYEGDLCTVEVVITRNHLVNDDDKAGLVHAPYFPFPKKEAFWVLLGQIKEGKILAIDKIGNPSKRVVHRIKFMAPPRGTYHFDLIVKSNGYVGIDQQQRVELITLDNTALPEYKVHPEDAALDDEPTLFEEMLNAHIERDSDDEEDEDDQDEHDVPSLQSAGGNNNKNNHSSASSAGGAAGAATGAAGNNNNNGGDMTRTVGKSQAAKKREQLLKARQAADDDDDDDDNAEEVYADK